jgi:Protein of unknown function (DUF3119)
MMTMMKHKTLLVLRQQQQQPVSCRIAPAVVVVTCMILFGTVNVVNIGMVESFPINTVTLTGITTTPISTTTTTTTTTRLQATNNNNFLENILSSITNTVMNNNNKNELQQQQKPKYENVIIEPDYRVATLFLTFGILLDTIPYIQFTLGPFITLLGLLFLIQTFRIRFVFNEQNQFELKTITPFGMNAITNTGTSTSSTNELELQDSGENIIVGGANCWDCTKIVNYDFFPKSLMDAPFFGQPILIYFKETQTPDSTWNEGPGKIANDPVKIQNGIAIPGQVHFFPAICNAQQIQMEFQKRNCQKVSNNRQIK